MKIEDMRAFGRNVSAGDEGCGSVRDILKICRTAKADVKRKAKHCGLHGFRRIARQPCVAVDAVHCQRPKSDAGQSVIQKEDASVTFVRPLEDAVVRQRLAL